MGGTKRRSSGPCTEQCAERVDARAGPACNRRGSLCPQCGWVAECTDCQVTLTYHAKGGHLSCHYCNKRRAVPQVCDACHFNPLLYLGVGTQRIEDLLQRTFPRARIERMDADTTAGKGGHAKILGRLAAGEIDVLVGTQMIAKGHDYPGVTLVGVLNADTGLGMPDFRAAETTFQLLTQVAGRAGRGDKPGHVIIQTYRPTHYAVVAAAGTTTPRSTRAEIRERETPLTPTVYRQLRHRMRRSLALNARRRVPPHCPARNGRPSASTAWNSSPAPAIVRRVKKIPLELGVPPEKRQPPQPPRPPPATLAAETPSPAPNSGLIRLLRVWVENGND